MADILKVCSVSKCTTVIDERALTAGGLHYLFDRWVAAVRSGATTKCHPHYLDTDIPTVYADYIKGARPRRNREKN